MGRQAAASFLTNIARVAFGLGIGATVVNSSLYTVDGGQRAVLFDRFRRVIEDTVGEGTHFLIPWLQKPFIFDIRPHTFSSVSDIVAPAIEELSWDFATVWQRVRSLPADQDDVDVLHKHVRRLASRVFEFPRHLRVPGQHFPRIRTPPLGSVMSTRSLGIADRMQLKPKKAKRTLMTVGAKKSRDGTIIPTPREGPQAEVTIAIPPPVQTPAIDLTEPGEEEEPERKLVLRQNKRPREKATSAGSSPPRHILEPPIRAKPLSMKRPETGDDLRREFVAVEADTSRGKPYFGRNIEKA